METALILALGFLTIAFSSCFNPCFIGNCSHTNETLALISPDPCFNPCFIGNCSHTLSSAPNLSFQGCFNPCFIGNCSHTPFSATLAHSKLCFNPCFIGNCSHTYNSYSSYQFLKVSILVLLETALIPEKSSSFQRHYLRFNPCFIGNCSHTRWIMPRRGEMSQFQSLFYWKLLSYMAAGKKGAVWKVVSILVLLETALILFPLIVSADIQIPVSILVLLETALIPTQTFPSLFSLILFQSLFYWKLLSYSIISWISCVQGCSFNPCFIGNCSHTKKNGEKMKKKEEFQSLFYWKLLSYSTLDGEV